MAAAEAMSEGAWGRLFNDPHPRRFDEPTVAGVDFPTVSLRQAWWDPGRRRLAVSTSPQSEAVEGRRTAFRVTNLGPGDWRVEIDGEAAASERLADGDLAVQTTVGRHGIVVHSG